MSLTDKPNLPSKAGFLPTWMTRGALGIVLATFFSDVGHEMVTAVLPLYLTSIGLGPAALGIMEGMADFAFSLSKLAGGVVGHHVKHKRPLAAAGYGVTAVCTAAIALVSSAFAIGTLRVAAWIGRGFRGPLRDFLLADEVETTHFGRAYGVERTADMLGAVAGPLIALLMLALGAPIVAVIAVSFVPALLSAFFILTFTRDRVHAAEGTIPDPEQSRRLPRRFWWLVAGVLLFGLGDFSRTFLIFLVADSLGGTAAQGALTGGVLAYTAHNVVSGLAALPAGRLGDRIPKWKVLVGGYALGVATNFMLAGASSTLWGLAAAVIGSGVYIAVEETVEKAAVAELLPRHQRSLGFGILASANAVGDMVSSLYVGTLLAAGRGATAFAIAGAVGATGTVWVFIVGRGRQRAAVVE
jgi:MFS family permease